MKIKQSTLPLHFLYISTGTIYSRVDSRIYLYLSPLFTFIHNSSFGRRGQRDFASVAFYQGLSVRPEVSSSSTHTLNSFVTLIHSPHCSSAWIAATSWLLQAGYGFFFDLFPVGGNGGRRGFGLGGKSVPSPFFTPPASATAQYKP